MKLIDLFENNQSLPRKISTFKEIIFLDFHYPLYQLERLANLMEMSIPIEYNILRDDVIELEAPSGILEIREDNIQRKYLSSKILILWINEEYGLGIDYEGADLTETIHVEECVIIGNNLEEFMTFASMMEIGNNTVNSGNELFNLIEQIAQAYNLLA